MDRIIGSVFGFAYGDAYGFPTEFSSFAQLKTKGFASFPIGNQTALISDDTQMSISTLETVFENTELFFTNQHLDENKIAQKLADNYLLWAKGPKNNRAPGNTCMTALSIYSQSDKTNPYVGEQKQSKGCGANMRNPWLGLLNLTEDNLEHISIIQSRITHGHPLALSAAVITALTVRNILNGVIKPGEGYNFARTKTNQLLNQPKPYLPAQYYEGLQLLEQYLTERKHHYTQFMRVSENTNYDICEFFGGGWVAEEAYLNAIAGYDKLADTPVQALHRLANTSGDSDSLSAIAGSYIGAYAGNIWPEQWYNSLEEDYLIRLETIANLIIEGQG